MTALQHAIERIGLGEVVPNIGQLSKADCRTLDRYVRWGIVEKGRGYWFPVAGAPFGIGPLKTCYGPPGWPQRWEGMMKP